MRTLSLSLVLTGAVVCTAGIAGAATVAPPAHLGELAVLSDAVVLARAGASWGEPGAVIPSTVTRFTTVAPVAGREIGATFEVVEPGGVVDGVGALVPGASRYRNGVVYLLFLGRTAEDRWRSRMLAYGLLERDESAGEPILRPVPQAAQISLVSSSDVERPGTYLERALIEHLREVVHEGRPWRSEAVRVEGLAEPKTTEIPDGCEYMEYTETGHNIRWFIFETGGSAKVYATAPGQDGIADGGVGAVSGAGTAWTDDAGSRIFLDYLGVIDQNIDCTEESDSDFQPGSVVFNDPCDDIDSLVGCTGTLAFGGPRFYVSERTFDDLTWHPAFDLFVIVNEGTQCIGETDFKEVITHEIGHGLGFGHYGTGTNSTMFFQCCRGWGASLGPQDETCAAYLYPTAGEPEVPLAPTALSATVISDSRIDLSWSDRANNEDSYLVFRDTGAGFAQIAALAANTVSYPDTALQPCTSASYHVIATNSVGDSDPSNTVSAMTSGDAPDMPTRLSATVVTTARIDLAWTNGAVAQSSVRVYRADSGGSYFELAAVDGTATAYTDATVQPARAYGYMVQGINSCGTSAYSAPVTVDVGEPPTSLLLNNDRFSVQVLWTTSQGDSGTGEPVQLTTDTGYFWFLNEDNVEMVIKLLDGCPVNNSFWVFAGGLTDVETDVVVTDTATGQTKTYTNPQQTPFQPIQDTSAFATCDAAGKATRDERLAAEWRVFERLRHDLAADAFAANLPETRAAAPACTAGPTTLCLGDGRFKVETQWSTAQGTSGAGQAVQLTLDTGYFWFFKQNNVEMVVKVLKACGVNGHYWVFAGGLTDVEVIMTVTDTQTDQAKVYMNPQQTPFQPIQDTGAFATCP